MEISWVSLRSLAPKLCKHMHNRLLSWSKSHFLLAFINDNWLKNGKKKKNKIYLNVYNAESFCNIYKTIYNYRSSSNFSYLCKHLKIVLFKRQIPANGVYKYSIVSSIWRNNQLFAYFHKIQVCRNIHKIIIIQCHHCL